MFDLTPTLDCAGRPLALDRPRIAGIVNVTADSFSDGGRFLDPQQAVAYALTLVEKGADLLDVGGESTRPGASEVSAADEIARVVPVIEALAKQVQVPIAIDTSKPEVMRAAVAAGAGLINDVYALRRDGALDAAAELKVPVCLMHMQGEPRTMQEAPHYDDVVGEVKRFLADRIFACELSGIEKKRILVDPGFGFGKTLEHNLALLRSLDQLATLGVPLLAGLSRKSMIGALTGRDVEHRAAGSAAAALIAVQKGAVIVRVHDVAATRDALAVWQGVASGAAPARKASKPLGSQRFDDDD
ncbi:MAG: dihydropteroate synthase [Rudaea sp.]|uniref:dihydropteroate synthase n=1 Tax=unclassified Rudaea TaxID=2627037 RepID=UPI0010F916ED|nr:MULTISPECIES: dihydropteroate synthase [unclassified Rudaea]MBN8888599.1 dihydropteroate synthase [Rudaea sp.]MBR0346406.1 dihydropteroate synthase [Rudaea sp.]